MGTKNGFEPQKLKIVDQNAWLGMKNGSVQSRYYQNLDRIYYFYLLIFLILIIYKIYIYDGSTAVQPLNREPITIELWIGNYWTVKQ